MPYPKNKLNIYMTLQFSSYLICEPAGIFELSNLDGRFVPYQKTLFGIETLTLDREQLPPDEDKKLKATVAAFLRLLSGYLLLNAAHQALEYLIRLYKYTPQPLPPHVCCTRRCW